MQQCEIIIKIGLRNDSCYLKINVAHFTANGVYNFITSLYNHRVFIKNFQKNLGFLEFFLGF